MRAAVCTRYGPPEVLEIRELPKPVPSRSEVLIRNVASAVTASDCIVRAFIVPPRLRPVMAVALGFRRPRQPVLGLVAAGEVELVGRSVTRLKPGDRVYAFTQFRMRGYAEYLCVQEGSMIAKVPAGATYEDAAAIVYGGLLAMHFLRKAQVQAGQKVLVYGASGAIGTAAVQLARYLGAEVAGVCSGANVDLVRSLGADPVIDYTAEDFRNRAERYDVILNAVGKRKAQLEPGAALAPKGRHVTVDDGLAGLRKEDMLILNEAFEAGKLQAVIDRRYRLEEIVEAHRYVDGGHKKGNVVLVIAEG